MRVNFCDLCDCPIHKKKHILSICSEEELKSFNYNSNELYRKDGILTVEICENCFNILQRLFTTRKKGLADLVKMLEDTFKMTCTPKKDDGDKTDDVKPKTDKK